MEGKGENGLVEGSSDCEDERAKLRPADIDADVREMERRKRVEAMMSSRLFREELERIVEAQMKDGAAAVGPLLQQIQDMIQTGPARSHNSFSVKSTNCVIPINDIRGVESMGYAKGEKILRCKLAAVYRLMDLYGWAQGISNHITGRLNQEEELLLVNAFGMLYHEVTASSLVKVDMQGSIVEPGTTNYGVNVQGFHLHAAIHQARPDIKCIIHVHTPSVLAVSSLKVGLLPLSNESVVIGEVSSHQSSGSIQEPEEKDKLARNLGPINKVMLLSNNGAVCCGETVEEAFFNVYNTVLACESQMKVMPLGVENLVLMQDEARKAIYDGAHKVPDSTALPSTTGQPTENKEKRWRIGGLHFEALMRMLDNAGFRTGYIYRTPLIKGEPPKPRSDVEVPPAVSSLGYLLEEEEMYRNWKKMGATKNDRSRWLNSPNVYQKVEILETGTPDPKKITKWVADGSPTHSSTPVKINDMLQFVPKNTNPKEFKKLQQQIKENRRADKITSGPQSHILEGVSWEDAKKLQDANLTGAGDQVVLVGAASKGIIQREFQHNATVYKTPYTKNPFDSISAQEIEEYKRTVTRKQRGESYDEEQSESEALSSSAALPPSGFKSPPSETDEDSRTEPRVLRIETKTAPIPSQAEYVLSDDGPRKLNNAERIRCYTRFSFTPSPALKERPVIVDKSSVKKPSNDFKHSGGSCCLFCKRSVVKNKSYSSHSLSNRSTQTVLSICEISDEKNDDVSLPKTKDLRQPSVKSSSDGFKRRPVVRKLAMDSVIGELKDKIRGRKLSKSGICNLDDDGDDSDKSFDEELTSCTLYRLPSLNEQIKKISEHDFSSEGTTTRTASSLTDESSKGNDNQPLEGLESCIGKDFEGWESMSEKPLPSVKLTENLDSYTLSDLLSNIHITEDKEDKDSLPASDIFITHHTNSTKKAVLMKNNIPEDDIIDSGYTILFKMDMSAANNTVLNVDFIDTEHSTSCEETPNKKEKLVQEISDDTLVYCPENNEDSEVHVPDKHLESEDKNLITSKRSCEKVHYEEEVNEDAISSKIEEIDSDCLKKLIPEIETVTIDGEVNTSSLSPCDNNIIENSASKCKPVDHPSVNTNSECKSCNDQPLDCKSSHCISLRGEPVRLTINGEDLFNFYEDFEPNEVFQKDSDNVSTQVHYDNQSLECTIEDDVETNFEEDSIKLPVPNNTPVVVNENIFIGKKYLMSRYLSGKSKDVSFEENSYVFVEDEYLSDGSSESKEAKSKKDNNCANSEDSAVFSELTVKTCFNPTSIIDSDKVMDWSLSDNSKGELSVDSSRSSGIRMSSTSEEDVPGRPIISSIDEFLIKETICQICPEIEGNSLCNSRLSYPTYSKRLSDSSEGLKKTSSLPNIFMHDYNSLLCNLKHRLNCTSYNLPSKSKICSYYTLVSGLDRYLSLPDLANFRQSSSSDSDEEAQTDSTSGCLNKELTDCEFDDHEVYISDDFISHDTDSEPSVSSNVLYFLNDSNCMKIDEDFTYESADTQIDSKNNYSTCENFEENNKNIEEEISCDQTSPSHLQYENLDLIAEPGTEASSETASAHKGPSGLKTHLFKDCLKCFAYSLDESLDNFIPNQKGVNTIISFLKRKFSKHKCSIYDLKKSTSNPFKKSRNAYHRYSDTVLQNYKKNEIYQEPKMHSYRSLSNIALNMTEKEYNESRGPCDSSLYYSCISDGNYCSSNNEFEGFENSGPAFCNLPSTEVDQDFMRNEDHSNQDQLIFSARSESFISLPSSTASETETFYSLGVCEPIFKTSRSRFHYGFEDNDLNRPKSERGGLDHETINIEQPCSEEISFDWSYETNDSSEDVDNLHEIAINVSSVSCQTDESMQDDEVEYRPEDFTENPDIPYHSIQRDASSHQQLSLTTPHQLYTIFETSNEISPKY